jgi:general nucleoside transport system permease protein
MMRRRLLDGLLVPLLAVAASMVIGMVIVASIGYDPVYVYGEFLDGALGGEVEIGRTLRNSGPLILTGLSVAFAFRAGLFNIGANGQAIVGLIAGGVAAYSFAGLPTVLHVTLVIVAAAVAGAVWAGIAGVLKVTRGAHEVVTTIMLNYVAIRGGEYLLRQGGPLQDGSEIPQSEQFAESSRFAILWAPDAFTYVRLDFVLALVMAAVTWFILNRTSLGLQIRVVGNSPAAAEYAGMSVGRVTVIAMLVAGAFAGIAGASVAQSPDVARLQSGEFSVLQVGFTGIAVALLGRSHPLGVVLAGLLFGAMFAGANGIQAAIQVADAAAGDASTSGLGSKIVGIIQGLIVLFVGADLLFRKLVQPRRRRRQPPVAAAEAGA